MMRVTRSSSRNSAYAAKIRITQPARYFDLGGLYACMTKEKIMFDKQSVSLEWAGRTLTIETGRVARQADGAVLVTYGDTCVLATATFRKEAKPGQDFFPLTVNYMEKYYASGRIPGGFFKREGRPTEKETLTSRLIDRPIRPLFVKGFKNEVQVVLTAVSYDLDNDPDILGMVGASAALVLSGAPFMGPIGAARVGYKDGDYIINPTTEELEESELDLVVAGTNDAVMMVESEAKELSEDEMKTVIAGLVETTGATCLKDMGKIMGQLKSGYAGRVDMGKAGAVVKAHLCNTAG